MAGMHRPFRHVFAYTLQISCLIGAVAGGIAVIANFWSPELMQSWLSLLGFAFVAICAVLLGSLLGALILARLIYHVGIGLVFLCDGYFAEGDRVRILVGPKKGHIGRVYELWTERGQLRVEIDEQSKKDVTDVFGWNEVCKVSTSGSKGSKGSE